MNTEKYTEAYLKSLIANKVEENTHLEYKSSGSLVNEDKKKFEISKDVSAFANSAGGTLIYGVAENNIEKHLPERIDPIDRSKVSKEWLESIIESKIKPRVEGLRIFPIQLSSGNNHVAYIVDIPKSDTVHQADDKRYYKRRNFSSVPMEDYEIKDVYNRSNTPKVLVEFEKAMERTSQETKFKLRIFIRNVGTLVVKHISCEVQIPLFMLDNSEYDLEKTKHFVFDNSDDKSILVVLLPTKRHLLKELDIDGQGIQSNYKITGKIFADNMTPKQFELEMHEIPYQDKFNQSRTK